MMTPSDDGGDPPERRSSTSPTEPPSLVDGTHGLEVVFNDRFRDLVALARFVVGDRSAAEEVVAEAFARTLERWPFVERRSDPYPYVRTVTVRLAQRRVGQWQRRVRPLRGDDGPISPGPGEVVDAQLGYRSLQRAIASLSPRQRACVGLRYFEGLSTAETATALRISEGSVKSHLHRALAALAQKVDADDHTN